MTDLRKAEELKLDLLIPAVEDLRKKCWALFVEEEAERSAAVGATSKTTTTSTSNNSSPSDLSLVVQFPILATSGGNNNNCFDGKTLEELKTSLDGVQSKRDSLQSLISTEWDPLLERILARANKPPEQRTINQATVDKSLALGVWAEEFLKPALEQTLEIVAAVKVAIDSFESRQLLLSKQADERGLVCDEEAKDREEVEAEQKEAWSKRNKSFKEKRRKIARSVQKAQEAAAEAAEAEKAGAFLRPFVEGLSQSEQIQDDLFYVEEEEEESREELEQVAYIEGKEHLWSTLQQMWEELQTVEAERQEEEHLRNRWSIEAGLCVREISMKTLLLLSPPSTTKKTTDGRLQINPTEGGGDILDRDTTPTSPTTSSPSWRRPFTPVSRDELPYFLKDPAKVCLSGEPPLQSDDATTPPEGPQPFLYGYSSFLSKIFFCAENPGWRTLREEERDEDKQETTTAPPSSSSSQNHLPSMIVVRIGISEETAKEVAQELPEEEATSCCGGGQRRRGGGGRKASGRRRITLGSAIQDEAQRHESARNEDHFYSEEQNGRSSTKGCRHRGQYKDPPPSSPLVPFPIAFCHVGILMAHGGYFAGGVWDVLNERWIVHKTVARYVVRKGQGGKQSAHSGRTDTAGSQIRAAQEKRLYEEIHEVIENWCTNTVSSTSTTSNNSRPSGRGAAASASPSIVASVGGVPPLLSCCAVYHHCPGTLNSRAVLYDSAINATGATKDASSSSSQLWGSENTSISSTEPEAGSKAPATSPFEGRLYQVPVSSGRPTLSECEDIVRRLTSIHVGLANRETT